MTPPRTDSPRVSTELLPLPRNAPSTLKGTLITEAQLREFEEDGNIDDVDTARKNLGMVATETLASYGVDKVERTLAERPNRQAKVPSSSGFDLKDIGDKLTSSFDEMFGERD